MGGRRAYHWHLVSIVQSEVWEASNVLWRDDWCVALVGGLEGCGHGVHGCGCVCSVLLRIAVMNSIELLYSVRCS